MKNTKTITTFLFIALLSACGSKKKKAEQQLQQALAAAAVSGGTSTSSTTSTDGVALTAPLTSVDTSSVSATSAAH